MDAEGSMDAEGAVVRKPPHDKADILVALATVSGYKAWRFKTSGSVFVRTLVYVFNNYSDKLHLMDMLTKVSHTVYCLSLIKGKVLPYSSLSVGSRADPSVQAISPQVIFKIIPAVGCHYFPPGLQSPSQQACGHLPNLTVLQPVPSYTAWWQRHIDVNNSPKVATQLCPGENGTHDLTTASPTFYCYASEPPTCVVVS